MLQKRHTEHVFTCGQSFIVSHSRVAPVKKVTLQKAGTEWSSAISRQDFTGVECGDK
jgi:hypothetical protein